MTTTRFIVSHKLRPNRHRITAPDLLTYDNDFRVTSWSVNGGAAITQSYNADSQLTQAGGLNLAYNASSGFLAGGTLGVTSDAYQYTNYGETGVYRATSGGSAVYEVSYTRDALGRIESENRVVDGVSTLWSYRYDDAGRLVEVLKDGSSWSVYRYDSNGNRIEAATQSGLVAGVYDAQDRLLTYGNFSYTYTANGELNTKTDTATGQVTRYAYDVFGNLIRVDLSDGRVIEYVIDGANRRVGKKVNGVLVKGWLYKDSLKPVAELDGSGAIIAEFVYGSKYNVPDYVVKGGVSYRIISDHLGSPRLVINSVTGAVVSKLEYDEFGNVLEDSSAGFTPFGFAGGLYDSDTGLVRFGARDYEPLVGRWIRKDPIRFGGHDSNLFSYVFNDPVNLNDPYGLLVINNSSSPIVVKPEVSGKPLEVLPPGERYEGKQDGLYTGDGRVYKSVDDIDVIYNKDGSVNTRVSPDSINPFITTAEQIILGGWKDNDWLKEKGWPSQDEAKRMLDEWLGNASFCP